MLLRQKVLNAEILRESETKYRELANSITDIFFAMDEQSRCIYWNKASEQITGISSDEAVGKPFLDIFPEGSDSYESMKSFLNSVYSNREKAFTQVFNISGEQRVFSIFVYTSENQGVSILSKDITERIEVEINNPAASSGVCWICKELDCWRDLIPRSSLQVLTLS